MLLILHSFVVSFLVRIKTQELAQATEEKEAVQRRLSVLRSRMENVRKASIVSQLSNMIAHELAQPVGAARSFCDGLKLLTETQHLTPEKLARSLKGLDRGLTRIQKIVEKVRSYSKGNISRDASLGLYDVIKTAKDSLSQLLTDHVTIELNVNRSVQILGDLLEIELLFNNLLSNAAAAAKKAPNPSVSVTTAVNDDTVTVVIENNGTVLTDEDMQQLALPFVSATGPGHGLGVPISLSLAEANGGHLAFTRRAEGGLSAAVTLRKA